ncbi:MAG: N-acetylmuramoyl-L-alanine amidase [Bacilli bacterium]|nr:N-acetylmuramoyl-L-alanine amidase [Bacilli bacterium]
MKKYIMFILICFFICFFVSSKYIVSAKLPLKGKTIAIDAGHGGKDPGTTYKDIYEKDINLKISLYLKEMLKNLGANVIMTREGDYDLSSPSAYARKKSDFDNRIKLINNSGTDFYVSIHLNYLTDSRYSGPQVFALKDNMEYAKNIQDYLNKNLKGDRESKIIPVTTYMYRKLSIPGVLLECGFLSNATERAKLITDEYQKQVAVAIAKSIANLDI